MANEIHLPVVGNLTDSPELRFTPNGVAVANFTIASTPRFFDRQSNEWKDGTTIFVRCTVWREYAENVAESLTKGMRVMAFGVMEGDEYEDRDGKKRHVWGLNVSDVGPALKYATAKVTRNPRNGGGDFGADRYDRPQGGGYPQGGYPQGGFQQGSGAPPQGNGQFGGAPQGGGQFPPAQDPWSGQGVPSMNEGGEPPF